MTVTTYSLNRHPSDITMSDIGWDSVHTLSSLASINPNAASTKNIDSNKVCRHNYNNENSNGCDREDFDGDDISLGCFDYTWGTTRRCWSNHSKSNIRTSEVAAAMNAIGHTSFTSVFSSESSSLDVPIRRPMRTLSPCNSGTISKIITPPPITPTSTTAATEALPPNAPAPPTQSQLEDSQKSKMKKNTDNITRKHHNYESVKRIKNSSHLDKAIATRASSMTATSRFLPTSPRRTTKTITAISATLQQIVEPESVGGVIGSTKTSIGNGSENKLVVVIDTPVKCPKRALTPTRSKQQG